MEYDAEDRAAYRHGHRDRERRDPGYDSELSDHQIAESLSVPVVPFACKLDKYRIEDEIGEQAYYEHRHEDEIIPCLIRVPQECIDGVFRSISYIEKQKISEEERKTFLEYHQQLLPVPCDLDPAELRCHQDK